MTDLMCIGTANSMVLEHVKKRIGLLLVPLILTVLCVHGGTLTKYLRLKDTQCNDTATGTHISTTIQWCGQQYYTAVTRQNQQVTTCFTWTGSVSSYSCCRQNDIYVLHDNNTSDTNIWR